MVTVIYNINNVYLGGASIDNNKLTIDTETCNRIEYDLSILLKLYFTNIKNGKYNFNMSEAILDTLANEIKRLPIMDITVVEVIKDNTLMFRVTDGRGNVSNRVTISVTNGKIISNGISELVKFLTK
jgi:hypothetical protein